MYCSWIGKICIFVTMINSQDKILQKTERMIYFHIMFLFLVTFFFDISVNGWVMYKNKVNDMNNIAGAAIQRIEARKRFITDIELSYFAKVFNVDYQELLKMPIE